MYKEKGEIISEIAVHLLNNEQAKAKEIINSDYPHTPFTVEKRTYTTVQKMTQFVKDGFMDRYTGHKLVNPGMLKVISCYFPKEFPYQSHWKMEETFI